MGEITTRGSVSLGSRLRSALAAKYGTGSTLPGTSALLLDLSGSMNEWIGAGKTKIQQLRVLAAEFRDVRRFEFASDCSEMAPGDPVPDTHGGTNMAQAFLKVKDGGVQHVVLITDGEPDSESAAIRAAAGLKVDVFYVGPDPAPEFLRELCDATGGEYGKATLDRVRELTASVRSRLCITDGRVIEL